MQASASRQVVWLALLGACGGASTATVPATKPEIVADQPHAAEVMARLQPYQDAELLFGAVVALIDHDAVEYFAIPASPDAAPPTPDTWFELGSITKTYTGVLLADAIERGELTLVTPIASLLPTGVTVPADGDRPITVGDLVVHRSGLPRLPPSLEQLANPTNPYAEYNETQLVSDLARQALLSRPGEVELYSNYGAGLLGYGLGHKLGDGYLPVLRTRVLTPLGLTATDVTSPDGKLAAGHDAEGNPAGAWTFDVLASAGALRSTARDQVAFVKANLAAARGEPGPLSASLRRSHQVMVPATPESGQGVAMGWFVDGKGRYWHNGGTAGSHSFIAFDPATDRGVVMLAATSTSLVDKVALDLLDVLGTEPAPPLVPPTAAQLATFAGSYANAEGVGLRLVAAGRRLYTDDGNGGSRMRLLPLSATEFYLEELNAVLVVAVDPQTKAIVGVSVIAGGERLDLARLADSSSVP